jgi:branched-chain amino acid transport system ATP-binding protein
MTPRLSLKGLTVRFGGLTVLEGVDLAVAPGERIALFGPNGSGKSTLFNAMTGAVAVEAGSTRLDGTEITNAPPHAIASAGVVRSFQTPRVFGRLTVRDNIWPTVARIDDAALDYLLTVGGLAGRADVFARDLGLADLRSLECIRALAIAPSLLLLDEPTAGLSPAEAQNILTLLEAHLPQNTAVIVIEHRLDVLELFVDRAVVLHNGRIIADGTPGHVSRSDIVRDAYLGRAA